MFPQGEKITYRPKAYITIFRKRGLSVCIGLVPEPTCQVAEERAHAKKPWSTSAQRSPADVQRSSDSTGRTVAPRARQTRPEASPTGGRAHAQ